MMHLRESPPTFVNFLTFMFSILVGRVYQEMKE